MYDHRYTPVFWDCVHRYDHRPDVMAAITQTLAQLAMQPFGNPKLQTHAVKKAQSDTFTSRVTNQGHRLIWRRVEQVIILLLVGEHDAVYRRAEKLTLEIDDSQNVLRVMDEDPRSGEVVPYQERRAGEGKLFMAWNDHELQAMGFADQEVPVLRRLDTDEDLTALSKTMAAASWERAMNLVMYGNAAGVTTPDGEQPAEEPVLRRHPPIRASSRRSPPAPSSSMCPLSSSLRC